jgi:hypothetical protein
MDSRSSFDHFTDELLYESRDDATTKLRHARLAEQAMRQEKNACLVAIDRHAMDIQDIRDRVERIDMDISACDKGKREVEAYIKCLDKEIEHREEIEKDINSFYASSLYPFQLAPRREPGFVSTASVRQCLNPDLRERRSRQDRLKLDNMAREERYGVSEVNITPTARNRAPVKRFGFNY